jgi:hypothetical protein
MGGWRDAGLRGGGCFVVGIQTPELDLHAWRCRSMTESRVAPKETLAVIR